MLATQGNKITYKPIRPHTFYRMFKNAGESINKGREQKCECEMQARNQKKENKKDEE